MRSSRFLSKRADRTNERACAFARTFVGALAHMYVRSLARSKARSLVRTFVRSLRAFGKKSTVTRARSNIHQTRETVFHRDIQTPRKELKIRREAEYF